MREKITTFLLVTLVTLTIWLFAEAESLGHETLQATCEITPTDSSRLISPAAGWDNRVAFDLSGSRNALERAQELLGQPLKLPLPEGLADGEQGLNLLEAFQSYEPLVKTGVTVDAVRPLRASVLVQEIVTRQVPIRVELTGVEVQGSIAVTPDRAEVKLPRALSARLGDGLEVTARIPPDQRSKLAQPGPIAVQAEIALPDSLFGERGVQLLTPRASLAFSVRDTTTSVPFAFPVQVLALPVEWGDWEVVIQPEDQRLTADVSGASDLVERLKSGSDKPIAVLSLTSDELAKKITSKEVGFVVLRAGIPSALPAGLTVSAERRIVRFTIQKRGGGEP